MHILVCHLSAIPFFLSTVSSTLGSYFNVWLTHKWILGSWHKWMFTKISQTASHSPLVTLHWCFISLSSGKASAQRHFLLATQLVKNILMTDRDTVVFLVVFSFFFWSHQAFLSITFFLNELPELQAAQTLLWPELKAWPRNSLQRKNYC